MIVEKNLKKLLTVSSGYSVRCFPRNGGMGFSTMEFNPTLDQSCLIIFKQDFKPIRHLAFTLFKNIHSIAGPDNSQSGGVGTHQGN